VADGHGLVSGEGVAYELRHAGLGSRTVAAFLDLLAQAAGLLALIFLDLAVAANSDSDAVSAVILVELVAILAGYPVVCEWLSRGRTLGKLCMGLRVVRDDGGPIGFRHALVRGIAGLVLEKPGLLFPVTTVVGYATMTFSGREKRLGDMMAGTFVLNTRAGPQRSALAWSFWVPYELQPWAMALDLTRLDDRLALALRQFVVRADQMRPAAQVALGEDLRARVLATTAPAPPPWAPTPPVLMTVLAERRRRAELLTGPRPAWPPAAPPMPAWPGGARPTASPDSPFAPPS
jgi:uncharacterized RDD family membrane protein YckC